MEKIIHTEKWYVLVKDGVVVQKQPYHEDGFIEAPKDIVCGFLYDGKEFTAPPVTEYNEEV